MTIPETRPSLLLRIRDPKDGAAWEEFESLYRGVVLQMAIRHGMQTADAEDLGQQVLWAISRGIERFDPQSGKAKFRTWLKTVARRAILNALTRRPGDRARGGDEAAGWLERQPADDETTRTLTLEYRREVFQVAARMTQPQFDPDTWQAFWRTAVESQSARDVANELNRTVGSVYTARSRVLARLRQWVAELDLDQEPTS